MERNPKTEPSRIRTLFTLFGVSLYISAFTFGGGFVIVTLMKRHYVDRLHWIDEQEMLDLTALAQTAPGPIAVNASILVGRRVAGFWGMIAAVLGTVIPPIVLLSIVSVFYAAFAANRYVALFLKGMQAGVAAVILDVVTGLGIGVLKQRSWLHDLLMGAAFLTALLTNVNVIWILLFAIVLGTILALVQKRRAGA